MRLASLLTRSGSGTSGGPTAGRVCDMNAWCSMNVNVVHVMADQEHSDRAVPRYRYRMELVWRFIVPTTHAQPLDSTINACTKYI